MKRMVGLGFWSAIAAPILLPRKGTLASPAILMVARRHATIQAEYGGVEGHALVQAIDAAGDQLDLLREPTRGWQTAVAG